jgi:hypothetical protein
LRILPPVGAQLIRSSLVQTHEPPIEVQRQSIDWRDKPAWPADL